MKSPNPSTLQQVAQKMLQDKAFLMKAIREGKNVTPNELKKSGIELAPNVLRSK